MPETRKPDSPRSMPNTVNGIDFRAITEAIKPHHPQVGETWTVTYNKRTGEIVEVAKSA